MITPFTTYPRTILGIVGFLYILLGVFCAVDPLKLGEGMGYTFKENGIIEFVVIYGGLEIGLGLTMLVAAFNRVLFPGIYFMALIVSLALPIARVLMHIIENSVGLMGAILWIELVVLAALVWPLIRRVRSE